MSGDQLNLDAIEAEWSGTKTGALASSRHVPALVAEVRRLRAALARAEEMHGWLTGEK